MEQSQTQPLRLSKEQYAPVALRIGLAIVFLLFGLKKLADPGQSTSEIQLLMNFDLADAAALSFYLGLLEILVALSFILGFKVRIASILASLFVTLFFFSFLSKYGLSINPDLYRDIGLLGACIALSLLGAGPMSVDHSLSHKE